MPVGGQRRGPYCRREERPVPQQRQRGAGRELVVGIQDRGYLLRVFGRHLAERDGGGANVLGGEIDHQSILALSSVRCAAWSRSTTSSVCCGRTPRRRDCRGTA